MEYKDYRDNIKKFEAEIWEWDRKQKEGDKLVAQWYLGKLIKAGTKIYEFDWRDYQRHVTINGGVSFTSQMKDGLWAI